MTKTLSILLIIIASSTAFAQQNATLDDVIRTARHQSVEALKKE